MGGTNVDKSEALGRGAKITWKRIEMVLQEMKTASGQALINLIKEVAPLRTSLNECHESRVTLITNSEAASKSELLNALFDEKEARELAMDSALRLAKLKAGESSATEEPRQEKKRKLQNFDFQVLTSSTRDIDDYFSRLDLAFDQFEYTAEKDKYAFLVGKMGDGTLIKEITRDLGDNPYTRAKSLLKATYSPTVDERLTTFFDRSSAEVDFSETKCSVFLAEMEMLVEGISKDDLLRWSLMRVCPANICDAIKTNSAVKTPNQFAKAVDAAMTSATCRPSPRGTVSMVEADVNALTRNPSRWGPNRNAGRGAKGIPPQRRGELSENGLCYTHRKYGNAATNCWNPDHCSFRRKGPAAIRQKPAASKN